MIRQSWLAQQNLRRQRERSPGMRMSWLALQNFRKRYNQSPRSRMSWFPLIFPAQGPSKSNCQDSTNLPAKGHQSKFLEVFDWIFLVDRHTLGGWRARGDGMGFWWSEVVARVWIFHNTGLFFLLSSHVTDTAVQPDLSDELTQKHTHTSSQKWEAGSLFTA